MSSIALKQYIAAAMLVTACGALCAQDPPSILEDPLLDLRYERAKVRFESWPSKLVNDCPVLADDEYRQGVWFVFAKSGDASGWTYYLLNGYDVRKKSGSTNLLEYSTGGHGLIVMVRGPECLVIDNDARETFRSPVFNDEYPQDIHQRLAIDFAARLSSAFGGKEKLRAQILKQRVDLDMLPDELRHALRDLRLPK